LTTTKASSPSTGEEAFVVARPELSVPSGSVETGGAAQIDCPPPPVHGKVAIMLIRREASADRAAIHAVHSAAFRREDGVIPVEAPLVDELRAEGDLIGALSLVALHEGDVVGHVCCSRARVGEDTTSAVGLGPLGVLPAHQASGVGSALMHAVVGAADALGYGLVVLLGEPAYYSRFGFVTAADLSITAPDPRWGRYFQARTLSAYAPTQAGAFEYAPAFSRI
jgi:putative acetyltransferase